MRLIRITLMILIAGLPVFAHVPRRVLTSIGPAFERWSDTAFPIRWRLNPSVGSNVTGTRNVADVLRGAFQAWAGVATAQVSFSEGPAVNVANAAQDGLNVISFVPTTYNRDAPSLTILYTTTTARIMEADVLFNPQALLSTDAAVASNRFDVEALALHEIGHLLGLEHSGLFSAVMFPALTRGNTLQRVLSMDDVLGISSLYPAAGFFSTRGSIQGTVRNASGTVVSGAHVVVADGSGKPVASTLSESDGTYFLAGLEPGNYSTFAEPFDEPGSSPNAAFTTRFALNPGSPAALTVNKTGGDNQSGAPGQALAQSLEVTVLNSNGSPAVGTLVRFAGTVVPIQATTDTLGKARTTAYLGKTGTHTFVAYAGTSSATFTATASAASISAITFLDILSNTATGEIIVNEGNTVPTELRVLDSAGNIRTDTPVTYSSLSPEIASVDSGGLIRGVKAGFSTLTVTAGSVVARATITVVQVNAGASGEVSSVAIDRAKRLYLAATQNHTILTAATLVATPEIYAGVNQSPGLKDDVRLQSQFKNPSFLAVDPIDGTVYVSDSANNVIRKIQPGTGGRVETWTLGGALNNPQGIALDDAGYLWVADSGNHVIRRMNLSTKSVDTIAGLAGNTGSQDGSGSQARFNSPMGLAFEPESLPQQLERFRTGGSPPAVSVLVADTGNGVIRRIKATGEVQTIAASVASALSLEMDKPFIASATALQFNSPTGIGADSFGNIYFTEPASSQIKVILRNGQVVAAAQPNSLQGPRGLIVSESGRLLVADRNRSVREIVYGKPEITSVTPAPASGARVTISGKNFAPETLVLANGTVAGNIDIKNSETIELTVPNLTGTITLSVINRAGSQDLLPPQLLSLQMTPSAIDTTHSSASVRLDFSASDNLSGVSSFNVLFYSPLSFSRNDAVGVTPALTVTGSSTVSFPRFSEQGVWKIVRVQLSDAVGNLRTYSTSELIALGFPTELTVTSNQDVDGPILTSLSFTPAIDTTSGPANVTVNFSATDNLSGVNYFSIVFHNTSDTRSRVDAVPVTIGLNVTGTASVRFPQYEEQGVWKIWQISLTDAVGNGRTLNTAAIAALGFPTQLEVTSNTDITPPNLTALSFTPTIDTTTGPATVTVNFSATDNLAGVTNFSVVFHNAAGTRSRNDAVPVTKGLNVTGTSTVTFPQFEEQGFWKIFQIVVTDAADNGRTLNTAALAALGFPAELYIKEPSLPPGLSAINPAVALTASSVNVTITGANFINGRTAVTVSGSGVTVGPVVVRSGTALETTLTVDANAAPGNRTITVTTPNGTVTGLTFTITPRN